MFLCCESSRSVIKSHVSVGQNLHPQVTLKNPNPETSQHGGVLELIPSHPHIAARTVTGSF